MNSTGKVFKFIVDEMCGKIARWLRLLGFDTIYMINKGDYEDFDMKLLRIAIEEDRILITSDLALYEYAERVGVNAILIRESDLVSKLRKIFKTIKLSNLTIKPRCPICNSTLKCVDKEYVRDMVPKNVFERINKFLICLKCNKAYWFGSHWREILNTINTIGVNIQIRKCD